jgi:3',5'-nucleoside bisphosphate phosphatase
MRKFGNIIKISLCFLLMAPAVSAQQGSRQEIRVPDVEGYQTIVGDFHMHTVFSDGLVWPTVRVEEAWREGLDAISITDHLEYLPFQKDVRVDYNRSYEVAIGKAEELGILLIRGAEITRGMPPGHFNVLFLDDVSPLRTDQWRDAFRAAMEQKAFIFWNHPGWRGQQPDGVSRWLEEHTEILENGWMHGIEVVNGKEYYPEVFQWCNEKNLTLLGNSDVHHPIGMSYDLAGHEHRPMTLVFAESRSLDSVREALFAGRTVVWWEDKLMGPEKYLQAIFNKSVRPSGERLELKGTRRAFVQLSNESDIDYTLKLAGQVEDLSAPDELTLWAGRTVLFPVRAGKGAKPGQRKISVPYRVENLFKAPEEPVQVSIDFTADFQAE